MNVRRWILAATVAVSIAFGQGSSFPAPPPRPDIVWTTGFTAPHRTATLSAVVRGRISSIAVREGDAVRVSDRLVELDQRAQQARVAMATIDAQSTADLEIARVRLELATHELDRIQGLGDDATPQEHFEASANAQVRRLEHERAHEANSRAVRQQALQEYLLDELTIRAPFDGYVSERFKEPGETVEVADEVLKITQLDPLTIRIDVPMDLAIRLMPGERISVRPALTFLGEREAEVEFVSRVADAASQSMSVRLTIANPDGDWPAGMRVEVGLPARDEQAIRGPAHASRSGAAQELE
jgi:RND family efflux transporter MFP subunit